MMSNVAEGFERGRLGEFHQFLSTAKASCAELRSQLYVALDVGYLDDRSFQDLRLQAEEVGRIIGGLRVSIARQRKISEVILPRTQHLRLRTLLKTTPGLNARISLCC